MTQVWPQVALHTDGVYIEMYAVTTQDSEIHTIFFEGDKGRVIVGYGKDYEEALEIMNTIITSFAALGYNMTTQP